MTDLLGRLVLGLQPSADEAEKLLEHLTGGEVTPACAGACLVLLERNGVTPEALYAFAHSLLRRCGPASEYLSDRRIPVLDVVGTGGDRSGSFNLSTGAALLLSAA